MVQGITDRKVSKKQGVRKGTRTERCPADWEERRSLVTERIPMPFQALRTMIVEACVFEYAQERIAERL